MQFLILLAEPDHFARWDAADEALRDRCFRDYRAFSSAVRERGRIVAGDALQDPSQARSVQPGTGRIISEGPFAETVEQIGGFYVVDLPDRDTAVELARLLPREYTVEVRPMLGITV